jgi:hypothetical protein
VRFIALDATLDKSSLFPFCLRDLFRRFLLEQLKLVLKLVTHLISLEQLLLQVLKLLFTLDELLLDAVVHFFWDVHLIIFIVSLVPLLTLAVEVKVVLSTTTIEALRVRRVHK